MAVAPAGTSSTAFMRAEWKQRLESDEGGRGSGRRGLKLSSHAKQEAFPKSVTVEEPQ